jgi:outer membrane autotransporter protein
MIKSVFAATAALSMSAGAAFAGPYVNIETNAGYTGNDYNAATTDLHVGFEGALGEDAGYYIQGGPAIVSVEGEDTTTEFSGKAGVGVDIAENVNVYGEVSFLTIDDSDDNNYGLKAGVKFSF